MNQHIIYTTLLVCCMSLVGCASNRVEKNQVFQLAQVHNQATKKTQSNLIASHYLVLPFSKEQKSLADNQEDELKRLLARIRDGGLYRSVISAAPINVVASVKKSVIATEHVELLMKQISLLLTNAKIESAIIFDKHVPAGQLYIEIAPKIKVVHASMVVEPLGPPNIKKVDQIKNKVAEHGLKL